MVASTRHGHEHAVLGQLKDLEMVAPYAMKDFHTDNGGEFHNWALPRHLTGRAANLPWTRSRACRKNDNAHCEVKNWTQRAAALRARTFRPSRTGAIDERPACPGMEPVYESLPAGLQAPEG